MRRTIPYFILILSLGSFLGAVKAQNEKYWVRFSDKSGTPYSIQNPEEYLSQAAIERRKAHKIPIDEHDLPVDPSYKDSVLQHPDVQLLHSSKWFNGLSIHCTDSLHMDTLDQISFIEGTRQVRSLKVPDRMLPEMEEGALREANETNEGEWHSSFQPGAAKEQLSMIQLDHLMELGYRGAGIRIAVLDAGFPEVDRMEAFRHIFEEDRYIGGFDAVEGDRYPFRAHAHGRAVLSILAAKKEGELLGAAPDAEYILCRTENASQEYRVEEHHWIAAAEFADSAGADILSTSLGYTTFDDSTQDYSPSDMDGNTTMITKGADRAASRGMLVVNSAGNAGNSDWGTIGAPADGDSVLSVGSVDSTKSYSSFSSKGPTADGRTKPEIAAMGEGTAFLGGDGKVYRGNGTSFSAPLISGAGASLWSAHEDISPMELYQILLESSHLYSNPNDSLGYGIPDLYGAYLKEKGVEVVKKGDPRILKIAPNPFHRNIEIQAYSANSKKLHITWYDPLGRPLSQSTHHLDLEQHHELHLQAPASIKKDGLYFLKLDWEKGGRQVFELVHQGRK